MSGLVVSGAISVERNMGTERCDGILRNSDGRALKTAVAAVVVAVALSGLVSAAPIDDGVEAAKRGDYATAMRILRPLAIKGDPRAQTFGGHLRRRPWRAAGLFGRL